MSNGTKVEMRPAFEWTCDDCGRDNFERAMSIVATEEEIKEQSGVEEWDEVPDGYGGNWLLCPDDVTCSHCKATFETEDSDGG